MSTDAKFTWLIPFLGLLSCLGPLSNDLYVPSLSLVETGLGIPSGSAQLTMSSVLIGIALGCLFYGPLSDKYGRKPALCLGLLVYVAAGVLAAESTELGMLVLSRALQGLGAASTMVLTRAIILDRWVGEEASRAMSWVAIFTFLTPVLAPVAGGYLAALGHWPAVFWSQAAAGLLCLVVTAVLLPRAGTRAAGSLLESIRAYWVIVNDRQTLGYMLCTGLAFVGLIAFVTNSSFVFVNYFGLEPIQYGFCFSFVMLGASLGAYTNGRLVRQMGISRMIGLGTSFLAAGGSAAVITGLLDAGLFPLLASILVYVFGIAFVFANAMARTMSRFRESSGAASAVFGVNQFLIGGIVAALLSLAAEPSPVPMVLSLGLAGVACAGVWRLWLGRVAYLPG